MKELIDLMESPSLERIQEFQRAHAQLPQIDVPVDHFFADGLYARPMYLKAGESVVGARHGKEHLCVVVGRCIVVDGTSRQELVGWNVLVSKPGAKRAIVAIEDTVWMTIHATKLTDVSAIEQEVLLPEEEPNRFFPNGKAAIEESAP